LIIIPDIFNIFSGLERVEADSVTKEIPLLPKPVDITFNPANSDNLQ
jgi:hypothetical protein